MSLLGFVGVAVVAAVVMLLGRGLRRPIGPASVAIASGATFAAALLLKPGEIVAIGAGQLVVTSYGHLFLTIITAAALVLAILEADEAHAAESIAGIQVTLAAIAVGLAAPATLPAIGATIVAGLAGVWVTVRTPGGRAGETATRELRVVVIGGAVAILAAAWVGRTPGSFALDPAIVGIAFLAFAGAVALRFGAVPFHLWAARLPDAVPPLALPALLVWTPAAFALVALTWVDRSVSSLFVPLDLERSIVVLVAAVTIAMGAVAAWLTDDVAHVVGYSIVADSGFVLLGLAATDPAATTGAREWILVLIAVKAALAGVIVVLQTAFETRQIGDLGGWGRRLPVLLAALVVAVVATIGLPAVVRSWSVRSDLAEHAVAQPVASLIVLAGLLSLLAYGRLLAVAVRIPGPTVAGGASGRLRSPAPEPREGARESQQPTTSANGLPNQAAVLAGRARLASGDAVAFALAAARLNRVPIASVLVLALAIVAFGLALGGLGGPAAAADLAPVATPAASIEPSPEPSAEASTPASVAPSTAPSAAGSPSPAQRSSEPAPTFSLRPVPSPSASG